MMLRAAAKRLVPPILQDWLRSALGRDIVFAGEYTSWTDASADASGYDSFEILKKVTDATRKVVAGEAAYERDSVLFDRVEHSFPILAGLLRAALEGDGALSVLDFGGALGSSYRQCREFLRGVKSLEWVVVEQEAYARVGRESFANAELSFVSSLRDAEVQRPFDVVLLSSVLQYLERPYDALDAIGDTGARYVIVDRTPFCADQRDHLVVQRVPAQIYAASYPCWIFSRSRFLDQMERGWAVLSDHPCPEGTRRTSSGLEFSFRGFILWRGA